MYVEKKSLATIVYESLKNKILNNELLPGDKLIEIEIAKELGVSRTPVREALFKLSKDGLAENFPRKSFIVSKISLNDAKDLYDVRAALEPLAVKELAEEGITERTQVLSEIIEDMKKSYLEKNLITINREVINWGRAIIDLSGNQILKKTLIEVNERLYRFANFIFRDPQNIKSVYSAILNIYEAIKSKEPTKAFNISYEYISGIYPMVKNQNDYRTFKYE
ncbi:putative transcriptional regulator, GntR family [Peptoniphilus sp. ING2-D1G]|nr:putative transcriptional regulator, GntR family [Peptoniphilus sp. ING2-D1G]